MNYEDNEDYRSYAFCFTHNNYTDQDILDFQNLDCKYIVFGKEVAPTTGTPHLQGYVYMTKLYTIKSMQKVKKSSYKVCKGTPEQNYNYCSKEDADYFERGVKPLSNKQKGQKGGDIEKKRWDDAVACAKSGNYDNIPGEILLRCYSSIKQITKDNLKTPPRGDSVCGVWIFGKSGCGKSRIARLIYPEFYDKMPNKWWDGYQNQPAVIIDDLDPKHAVLSHHIKRWSDRYAFLAENKGGAIQIRPEVIIITSQYSPEEIFDDPKTVDALTRRFAIVNMDEKLKINAALKSKKNNIV